MMLRAYPILLLAIAGLLPAQQSSFGDLAVCAGCHSQLAMPAQAVDRASMQLHPRTRVASQPAKVEIGPAALWPASMMAQSARDPYWLAKVRYETGEHPELAAVIEDTCLRCHAPMQQYDRRASGVPMRLDEIDAVGAQGVGCTVCHQITAQGFGNKESFEAGFVINGSRLIYGPHAGPFSNPMRMSSGFTPALGTHVLDSALCGTCHTVITPTVNSEGEIVGEFVEQSPFLEYLVSDLPAEGIGCQSCHMPQLSDPIGRPVSQYIAHRPNSGPFPPTSPRQPFGQHFLTGGNAPMLRLMAQETPENSEALSENLERTREYLANAISLELTGSRKAEELEIRVQVKNNTGHKLPTAFPSRRIWLHLSVVDSAGSRVFDSGAWDPRTGEIAGVGDFEPHREKIDDPTEVMIYESEMADTDGNLTVTLLRAARNLKDNRILPRGFDLRRPLPDGISAASIAPAGIGSDEDFLPGSDGVEYEIVVGEGAGPYRVTVEALYQSVKPGHAAAMNGGHSAEEANFLRLFASNRAPATMARAEILVR
jgi:cytochrome c554/c'-like protein